MLESPRFLGTINLDSNQISLLIVKYFSIMKFLFRYKFGPKTMKRKKKKHYLISQMSRYSHW